LLGQYYVTTMGNGHGKFRVGLSSSCPYTLCVGACRKLWLHDEAFIIVLLGLMLTLLALTLSFKTKLFVVFVHSLQLN